MIKYKRNQPGNEDIDVTPFMNLMVVLIPVLLLSMSFTQISVLELKLPELGGGAGISADPQSSLEIEVSDVGYKVYYPDNHLLKSVPKVQGLEEKEFDTEQLSQVLQAVKEKVPSKKDILVRSKPHVQYQDVVTAIDTVKAYQTVVAASVVNVELFPEVSLEEAR